MRKQLTQSENPRVVEKFKQWAKDITKRNESTHNSGLREEKWHGWNLRGSQGNNIIVTRFSAGRDDLPN